MSVLASRPGFTAGMGVAEVFAHGVKSVEKPFGQALIELARARPEIVGLTADLGKYTDIDIFGQAYPELETVILKGTGDVTLGRLALPRAKKLALRTSTLTKRTLASILAAPWPALEDLELWFGEIERGYGAECVLDDVLPLFAKPLPALRALRIMNSMFSDEIVPAIASWPGQSSERCDGGENSADLDYSATNSLALSGGTIKDAATNNATLTLPAVGGAN